ncbi:DNA-binding response regulator [Flavobacteriaceae bacterium M23B6Z8]
MKTIRLLIAENFPMMLATIVGGLKEIEKKRPDSRFVIDTVPDCESAKNQLKSVKELYKVVIFKINLQFSNKFRFIYGEDLGVYIRKKYPKTRVIILTSFTDKYRLYNIMQNISPEGLLVRIDFDFKELQKAFENIIIHEASYYSKSVLSLLKSNFSKEYVLDTIDRKLLFCLSAGVKMKDLPKVLPLSMGGIEKRKRNLKELFKADNDQVLLAAARNKGFL